MTHFSVFLLALAVAASMLSGCTKAEGTAAVPSEAAPVAAAATSTSLLSGLELTLPDGITREHSSDTADYFYQDSQIVGGIAVVEDANLASSSDLAIAVTRAVYDTDYDYIAGSSEICLAEVSISDQDKREFGHYFFSGESADYDIWMDTAAVDSRDMRDCLTTLTGDGISVTPASSEEDFPILQLRVELPDDVTLLARNATRASLLTGESADVQVGGIEKISLPEDLDAMGMAALELTEELYGEGFGYISDDWSNDELIQGSVITQKDNARFYHSIILVESDCYDVWTDLSYFTEEESRAIARSCHY